MAGSVKHRVPVHLQQCSQDDSLDVKHSIYISLLTLGFESEKLEQKEKLLVDEHAFRRMNQRLGDHILHYLFSCINSKQASKVFRDCWPIYDKKVEAQFRSATFEWLKSVTQSEEYNLKPSLVVSKAAVMPTSNKFMSSLATLCRIALHCKILQKDPSANLLYFPSLATKKDGRQKAMQLITKSKTYHCSQYVSSVSDRTKALQSLQSKVKELVDRYRAIVKERERINETLDLRLKETPFLSLPQKNRLLLASSEEFEREIEECIKVKNEKMRCLWSETSALKNEDETSWPKIEPLIEGEKGYSIICGEDFAVMSQIDELRDFPFVQEKARQQITFYKDGKFDLVVLMKISNLALTHLRDSCTEWCNHGNVEGETTEASDQLRCVTALREDSKDVQVMLSSILPSLLESVSQLRENIYSRSTCESPSTSDAFDLCPPTPVFNFETSNSSASRLNTPYQLVKLTPSCNDGSNICEEESLRELTHTVRNVSRLTLLQSLRAEKKIKKSHHTECGSPLLKNSCSVLPDTSANHTTVDSGCVLSCGADSLLRSLEKLDVTPKNRGTLQPDQNYSYAMRKSVLSNSNRNHSIAKKSRDSLKPSVLCSPLVSDLKVENQIDSFNVSFKIENKENRRKSIRIDAGNSFVRSKFGDLGRVSENHGNDDMNEIFLNLTLTDEDNGEHSCADECWDIMKKAHTLSDSPSLQINHSPLVTALLNEFNQAECESNLPKRRFQSYEKRFTESKESLSETDGGCVQHYSTSSKHLSTSKQNSSRRDISNEHFSTSSNTLACSAIVNPVNEASKDVMVVEKTFSPYSTTADVEKTFYSYISSLESRLEGLEEKSKYEFEADSVHVKNLIDVSNGFQCREEPSFADEKFVDSRTYLDECSNTSKWLPKDSVFNTITESFISGELASDLFFTDDVQDEIRRESLSMPIRTSLTKKSRRSIGISCRLSEYFGRRASVDTENLLDISDSCLLSTSSDAI